MGKINSKNNYRSIASSSTLSKVLGKNILNRIELFVVTSDKSKHDTDMCIFALKEILDLYNRHGCNSIIFILLMPPKFYV